jgi:hypothetical protein
MILSCGEALIDMLPRTTTLGEPAFSPYAGGAVFNTAIALGRLGAPSAFFSGISNDMLGQILTETLEASKVDTQYCARSDRPTTVASSSWSMARPPMPSTMKAPQAASCHRMNSPPCPPPSPPSSSAASPS